MRSPSIPRHQAEILLETYRSMNRLSGVGRDSMLMLCWFAVNHLLSHSLQFGGWRFYYDPATQRMEIEE